MYVREKLFLGHTKKLKNLLNKSCVSVLSREEGRRKDRNLSTYSYMHIFHHMLDFNLLRFLFQGMLKCVKMKLFKIHKFWVPKGRLKIFREGRRHLRRYECVKVICRSDECNKIEWNLVHYFILNTYD